MTRTHLLLKDFAENGSENAFRELAANYIDLVYSTALRKTGGHAHQAEDITQQVFADLARKARELPADVKLGGWLHRHCCFAVKMFQRTEMRRVANEREAMAMNSLQPDEPAWRELAPLLDDGIEQLEEEDREAIVLRFFESKNFREIGEVLGASDNAAQKRVTRALEKLRDHLAKAGAALTVAALAELLAARSVSAAPAALLGKTTAFALNAGKKETAATATVAGASLFALWKIAAVVAIVASGLFVASKKLNTGTNAPRQTEVAIQQNTETTAAITPQIEAPAAAPTNEIKAALAEPNQEGLKLTILAADSAQPIPNVPIVFASWEGGKFARNKLTGSRLGLCVVPISSNMTRVDLTTEVEGFADTRLQWRPEAGEKIPETYTLKLERGVKIGGKVVDARGELVPGAKVGFNLNADPEAMLRTESHEFNWIELTAEDGRWETDRITEGGLRRIYGGASHPKYVGSPMVSADRDAKLVSQLKSLEHTFVLADAVTVSGIVANENGEPIAGAEVLVGERDFAGSRTSKTGSDGKFSIEGCKPGKTILTGSAKNYAAKTVKIEAKPESEPVKLTLGPGYVLKMQVVGKASEPVKGAYVWLNTMRHGAARDEESEPLTQADFSPRTDKEGRVKWYEAPSQDLIFDFQAAGYMRLNEVKVRADGEEHVITLRPALTISGTVRDAETGAPIPKFRIISGWQQNGLSGAAPVNEWSTLDRFWFTFVNGKFEQRLEEPVIVGPRKLKYVFRFEAEGYASEVSRAVTEAEGKALLEITLKRQATAKLLVRGLDGNPAPNVDVVFADAQQFIRIQNGIISRNSGALIRATDSAGEVAWDSDSRIAVIAAVGTQGFAKAAPSELGDPPSLKLGPWGRVEGRITKRGKPVAGWRLLISSPSQGLGKLMLENAETTDENGGFAIEHAPSGSYKLVRLVPIGDRSYTHVELRDLVIEAGGITHADYDEKGMTAALRIVWPKDFGDVSEYRIRCSAGMMPPGWTPDLMNDPQRLAAWQQSPEVKAVIQNMHPVEFEPKGQGMFETDSMAPGKYQVNAFVMRKDGSPVKDAIGGSREIVVPDVVDSEKIDLGELALERNGIR
jgi:RNA polymerase sigma factor (sigma-70 family)